MASRINSPKVIHQVFETEVVIVNLETGNYYSVTGSGIEAWQGLDAGLSSAKILEHFRDSAESAEIGALLNELEREQLVLPESNNDVAVDFAMRAKSFTPPRLEKFTDMRELLLIDPIHELDESGWPRSPTPEEEK